MLVTSGQGRTMEYTSASGAVLRVRPALPTRCLSLLLAFCLACVFVLVGPGGRANAFVPVAAPAAVPAIALGGSTAAGVGAVGACVASVVCGLGVGAVALIAGVAAWAYLDYRSTDEPDTGTSEGSGAGNSLSWAHVPQSASFTPTISAKTWTGANGYVHEFDAPGDQWFAVNCGGSSGGSACQGDMEWQCATSSWAGSVTTAGLWAHYPGGTGMRINNLCLGSFIAYLRIEGTGSVAGQSLLWVAPWAPRQTVTTVTCSDGTDTEEIVEHGTPYIPGEEPVENVGQAPDCAGVLPDSWVQEVTVEDCQATTSLSTCRPVAERQLTPEATEDFADCFTGPGCTLRVWLDGEACTVGRVGCTDWKTRTEVSPGTYECKWGSYAIPLPNCDPLQEEYVPDTPRDPKTGVKPSPSTTAPVSPAGPVPSGNASNCPENWWSLLNPFALFGTLKCAFVPPPTAVQSVTNGVSEAATTSGLRPAWDAAMAIPGAFDFSGVGTSCEGPSLSLQPLGLDDYRPMNACSAPMSTLARISWVATTIAVFLGAALAGSRVVASAWDVNLSWRST